MKTFHDYSLKAHNTFGIEAQCSRFAEYEDKDELRKLLEEIRNSGCRFLHIGEGSNLLFTKDFDGLILHSAIKTWELLEKNGREVLLRVGAGVSWDDFVERSVACAYYGAENLSLIPGEVGACAVQNIGAYGVEIEQIIEAVHTLEVETGNERIFTHNEMQYAYRKSLLKGELKGQYIVTEVDFRLSGHFVPNLSYRGLAAELEAIGLSHPSAEQVRDVIVRVRQNKLPAPKDLGSAGSFFMNPVVPKTEVESLLAQYPSMPHFEVGGSVKIPAAWLIEQAGWKGRRVVNCGVYAKHALVLVNYGEASGADIVSLSESIICDVYEKFGIALVKEVEFV